MSLYMASNLYGPAFGPNDYQPVASASSGGVIYRSTTDPRISYTAPASNPVVTPTAPVQKQQPQSSGNFMDFYPGWNQSAAQADFNAQYGGDYGRLAGAKGQQNSGPSQDQINAEINNLYGGSYDYLNKAENALRADLPNVLNEAQSQYNSNVGQLGTQKTQANATLDTNAKQATNRKEDALSAARRIYDEQRQGAQQRFGGSTSAGQASSELLGRAQLQDMGQTNRGYNDTIAQVEQQRANVEQSYQSNLLQLEQQKQSAVNQANRDFQNKLLEIANNRAQLDQAKAQARLQALQELRNQVFAIDQQTRQFQQTLELQRQQAAIGLDTYTKQLSAASQYGASAANSFMPTTTAGIATNAGVGGAPTTTPTLTGAMTKRPEDTLMGPLGQISKKNPYQF